MVFVSSQFNYTIYGVSVPFLLPILLNFQGSTHRFGVGSFNNLYIYPGDAGGAGMQVYRFLMERRSKNLPIQK